MSPEEERILKLVAEGTISGEEGAQLLEAVAADEAPAPAPHLPPPRDEFTRLRRKFRWLGYLPLLPGLPLLVAGSLWLQSAYLDARYFWFVMSWLPFGLGVLLTWLGLNSPRMTWVFVNVRPDPADPGPRRIMFGFPLPLRLLGWGLRLFGGAIPALAHTSLDEILSALQSAARDTPLMVQVDDEGAQVEVFIG